jgi:hypothetical protein
MNSPHLARHCQQQQEEEEEEGEGAEQQQQEGGEGGQQGVDNGGTSHAFTGHIVKVGGPDAPGHAGTNTRTCYCCW